MSFRTIPQRCRHVRYLAAVVLIQPILERKRVRKLYNNLMPVGPVLERFQLRNHIHYGLHFRPILERQRVRGLINIADTIIYILVVRSGAVLGHPHQLLPEHGGRVRGGRGYLGQRGKLLPHAKLLCRC